MFNSLPKNAQATASLVLEAGERPKEFFKRLRASDVLKRAQNNQDRPVLDYSLENRGIENHQYWQGVSTVFTDWDEVYTGTGDTPSEAAEDALSQAAESGWDVAGVANDLPEEPSVTQEIEEQARDYAQDELKRTDYESDEDYDAALEETALAWMEEGDWDLACYAVLWVRGQPAAGVHEAEEAEEPVSEPSARMSPKAFFRYLHSKSPPGWPSIKRWIAAGHTVGHRRAFEPNSKRILRNTRFVRYREPGSLHHALRLYDTDVLRYLPGGDIKVGTGGYRTPTTKDRINRFLPHGWSLYQRRHNWYWWNSHWPESLRSLRIPFHEGDTLKVDGTLLYRDETGGPTHAVTISGNSADLEAVQEGRYLRKLAWIKRVKAKHAKMKEVKRRQKDLEDLDEPQPQEESAKDFIKKLRLPYLEVDEAVSTGTLHSRDLIERFLYAIQDLRPKMHRELLANPELVRYLAGRMPRLEAQEFEDSYLHEFLYDEMQQLCPPGTYFGSHPGSGADIGCWPMEESTYTDLAEQGEIIFAPAEEAERVQKITTGDFSETPTARYAIVAGPDYGAYTCYNPFGRVLWAT